MESWTKNHELDLFHVNEKTIIPLRSKDKLMIIEVEFEVELDRLIYTRARYNALDLLA